jgi:D-alanyl-D-alanine carboxypeptidase
VISKLGTLSQRGCWPLLAVLLALACASQRDKTDPSPTSKTDPEPDRSVAPPATASPTFHATVEPTPTGPHCREQPAQDFLLRGGQLAKVGASASERQQIQAARQRSIDYRTRQYGHFPGFGKSSDNPHPPNHYAKKTTFMGLPLVVHEKIVPALACVEAALRRECASNPYQPRQVSGIRLKNTYQDYEVSNHVYGIAIDIDSQLNPCCGCVGKWSDSPLCKKKVDSEYERMAMPRCWVEVFERYGFHWLGHDELGDTMHFEFLGDPERIME